MLQFHLGFRHKGLRYEASLGASLQKWLPSKTSLMVQRLGFDLWAKSLLLLFGGTAFYRPGQQGTVSARKTKHTVGSLHPQVCLCPQFAENLVMN